MTKPDWKEFIVQGLGGLLLFLAAGYAAAVDVLSFLNGRPLMTYYTKMSANNDFGIVLTFVLFLLAALGLMSFVYQVHHALKKRTGG